MTDTTQHITAHTVGKGEEEEDEEEVVVVQAIC